MCTRGFTRLSLVWWFILRSRSQMTQAPNRILLPQHTLLNYLWTKDIFLSAVTFQCAFGRQLDAACSLRSESARNTITIWRKECNQIPFKYSWGRLASKWQRMTTFGTGIKAIPTVACKAHGANLCNCFRSMKYINPCARFCLFVHFWRSSNLRNVRKLRRQFYDDLETPPTPPLRPIPTPTWTKFLCLNSKTIHMHIFLKICDPLSPPLPLPFKLST